ncbi:SAM-dependent methyltransferase [Mycobacterium paraffinicum]|uniref:S-adenosyl-L-methionine-dependent methyltransferase n=1 Tax=Mycobacterium paraffinicum TaxID=53378 RepID=A0A1Q4HK92_9MYCO|nr:SAM-dependent methyltransferase [Mycobacterium paraffinicum]OJZ67923.1 SAM-dependent methyltransferase [Mycobacterium paraffinicum]
MSVDELPTGVGWTGLLIAYIRAQETQRQDRLFADPLAMEFVAAARRSESASGNRLPRLGPAQDDGSSALWELFSFYFTLRTPFYDRRLLDAIDAGCRQVVLLGAGFDTRAFRLGLADDTTVFEVDQAAVLKFKERVLARTGAVPDCARVSVVADLRQDLSYPLRAAGFDPTQPTVWIAEGLLMYFSREQADRLLSDVTTWSAPGSRIIGEYFTRRWEDDDIDYDRLDDRDQAAWDLLMTEFLYGPISDSPGDWLSSHGWGPGETTTVAELGRNGMRALPAQFRRSHGVDVWLFDGSIPAISR